MRALNVIAPCAPPHRASLATSTPEHTVSKRTARGESVRSRVLVDVKTGNYIARSNIGPQGAQISVTTLESATHRVVVRFGAEIGL